MSSPVPSGDASPTAAAAAPSRTKSPIPSDPQAIEEQIRLRQVRLAETVDELTTRLSPKEIGRRSTASARQKVDTALRAEDGSLRTERVAAVAAAVLALLAAWVWRHRR
jgi:hypothetical protein